MPDDAPEDDDERDLLEDETPAADVQQQLRLAEAQRVLLERKLAQSEQRERQTAQELLISLGALEHFERQLEASRERLASTEEALRQASACGYALGCLFDKLIVTARESEIGALLDLLSPERQEQELNRGYARFMASGRLSQDDFPGRFAGLRDGG